MAAPTISAGLAAALAGSALASGVGSALAGRESANAAKDAALQQAKGPVRGGSERAGNQDEMTQGALDSSSIEKLGMNTLKPINPVYGNQAGQPIDLNALFKPNQFGQGYSVGKPNNKLFG